MRFKIGHAKKGYAQYPVNRKLTLEERSNQLHQGRRLNVEPFYNLSVIRMNSTYLECVDRWFAYRGIVTASLLTFYALTLFVLLQPQLSASPIRIIPNRDDLEWMLDGSPLILIYWTLLTLALRAESFQTTHYPIRFNYKNRMVYVFGISGPGFQAKWDDIFFTLGRCGLQAGRQNWDIRGHILDADRETVRATFSLPGDSLQPEQLNHCWEFFRRYMDDGPATIYQDVFWCHDVATNRESFRAGLTILFFMLNGFPIAQFILSPFFFACAIGRWFAMRTSKIPVWPAEVEAQCALESFDPYLRDAWRNPEKIPMETVAAARRREQR